MAKDISKTLEGWDYDPDQISVRIVHGRRRPRQDPVAARPGPVADGIRRPARRPADRRLRLVARLLPAAAAQARRRRSRRRAVSARKRGLPAAAARRACNTTTATSASGTWSATSCVPATRTAICGCLPSCDNHARHNKDKLQFDQWRPYVTMMHARAVATPLMGLRTIRRRWERSMPGSRRFGRFWSSTSNCKTPRTAASWCTCCGGARRSWPRTADECRAAAATTRWPGCRPNWSRRSPKSGSRTPPGCATRFVKAAALRRQPDLAAHVTTGACRSFRLDSRDRAGKSARSLALSGMFDTRKVSIYNELCRLRPQSPFAALPCRRTFLLVTARGRGRLAAAIHSGTSSDRLDYFAAARPTVAAGAICRGELRRWPLAKTRVCRLR